MTSSTTTLLRRTAGLTVLGSALFLAGCVVAPVEPAYTYTTYGSPPPPRYEVVPVAPSTAYIWTPGVWLWAGSSYHWRPGFWGPRHGHGPGPGWRGGPRGHR